MMHIKAVYLDFERGEENIHILREAVSDKRRCRADKFLRMEDRIRSLAGECLCRIMLSERLTVAPASLDFSEEQLGKPFVNGQPSIHFNCTHSGNLVACIVGDSHVGIDVERHKSMDYDIAERFFTREEDAYTKEKPNEYTNRFFTIWTLKESFLKAIGKGLHCPLDSFSVVSNNRIRQTITTLETNPMNIRPIHVPKQYSGAICFSGNNAGTTDVITYTMDAFLQRLRK